MKFNIPFSSAMRRDISIRIVALYELDNWGSIPVSAKR
jgi:hypothetical protein